MSVEEALKKLKEYANDFSSIGNANELIKNNKKVFMNKYIKVLQYFNYIIKNKNATDEQIIDAYDIIDDIRYDNSSLDEWVNSLISSVSEKKHTNQSNTHIDTYAITNQIESYVTKIRDMQFWDPSDIEDIEWKLQELKKILLSNKNYFERNLYQSLMDDIEASLDKIASFNNIINSEAIQNITR